MGQNNGLVTIVGNLPWRQWFATLYQALAIVAGILVAFAIDAWWEERNEQEWQTEQLVSLRDEFVANRDELIAVVGRDREIADHLRQLLATLKTHDIGDVARVDAMQVAALTAWRTSDVASGALDALLASGRLGEFEPPELRQRLAEWPSAALDFQEDEVLTRDFIPDVLVPTLLGQGLVATSYESQPLFFRSEPGETPPVEVTVSQELIELVTVRVAHAMLVTGSVYWTTERDLNPTLAMIDAELARRGVTTPPPE